MIVEKYKLKFSFDVSTIKRVFTLGNVNTSSRVTQDLVAF
jgi:hypothetical protein